MNIYPFVSDSYSSYSGSKQSFHKPQTLAYTNGFAVSSSSGGPSGVANQYDTDLADVGFNRDLINIYGQKTSAKASFEPFRPYYVEMDQQVLKFDAYFEEPVHDSLTELHHIRRVHIYYYLVDDTIAVHEPMVKDCGIMQGKLVRRQRVPRPDRTNECYHWRDFNLAEDVTIFGRRYRIVNCDAWTKEFFLNSGVNVNEPEPMPGDPYVEQRLAKRTTDLTAKPRGARVSERRFDWRKLIENEGKVLRFFATWDDSNGDYYRRTLRRTFEITYYLEDDTMQVKELSQKYDDLTPILVKRQRLPKCRERDSDTSNNYSPEDLGVGKSLNVYNRTMQLFDCDEYTRKFYLTNFGVDFSVPTDTNIKKETEKPPQMVFLAIMENAPVIFENTLFLLQLQSTDDAITISECATSGKQQGKWIPGRLFLQKCKIPKSVLPWETVFYTSDDLHIGGVLRAFRWTFAIVDADEATLQYLGKKQAILDEFNSTSIV